MLVLVDAVLADADVLLSGKSDEVTWDAVELEPELELELDENGKDAEMATVGRRNLEMTAVVIWIMSRRSHNGLGLCRKRACGWESSEGWMG